MEFGVLPIYPVWFIILSSTIAVLSVISNTVVLSIWLKRELRSHTTVLLSVLAVSDTVAVITGALFLFIADLFNEKSACNIFVYAQYVAVLAHTFSILLTTFIAIQRFVVCAFPFNGPNACGRLSSCLFVVLSMVISVTFITIPLSVIENVTGIVYTLENTTSVHCYADRIGIGQSEHFWRVFDILTLYAKQLLPLLFITISMSYCLYTVYLRKQMVSTNPTERKKINKANLMICLLMFVFVIGEMPTTIAIFVSLYGKDTSNSFLLWIAFTADGDFFCRIMIFLSYFMNIWIYIGMSKQFRDSLYRTWCCRKSVTQRLSRRS